jgi:hypothetical protein
MKFFFIQKKNNDKMEEWAKNSYNLLKIDWTKSFLKNYRSSAAFDFFFFICYLNFKEIKS